MESKVQYAIGYFRVTKMGIGHHIEYFTRLSTANALWSQLKDFPGDYPGLSLFSKDNDDNTWKCVITL